MNKVLILDKADWLRPEYGPGNASGRYCYIPSLYGEGNGEGNGEGRVSKHKSALQTNGCGYGKGYLGKFNE